MPSSLFVCLAIVASSSGTGQNGTCDPGTDLDVLRATPNWVVRWDDATNRRIGSQLVGARQMMNTPRGEIPFDRLRFLEPVSSDPIVFDALARDFGGIPYVKRVVLENPVLMVTFDQNVSNQNNPVTQVDWESYRPIDHKFLQEYVVNPNDGETNQWFTSHPNGRDYVEDQLGLDWRCFNANTAGEAGCNLAATQALASVGVYWAGSPLSTVNPAEPCDRYGPYWPYTIPEDENHLWWQDRVLIFIADRSSFIRPSFNPTTTKDPAGTHATADGVPRWDGSSYVFPQASDPLDMNGPSFEAYLEATRDFVGYIKNGNGPNGIEVFRSEVQPDGTFVDGFKKWHEGWRKYCWGDADCAYFNWPFSGIGITVNWTQMPASGAPDFEGPYSAASEFISVGEKPIYLVAIREAHEYFGSPRGHHPPRQPQRSTWCDVCPGDYDQNGHIDGGDLAKLLAKWGTFDLCITLEQTDPIVNGNDLSLLLANWGRFCEWPLDWRPEDCERTP